MALLLGFAALGATLLGGLFALRYQDKLHLILGFSAGAVLGVALFDLLPEAFSLAGKDYAAATVTLFVAVGFFAFMFLNAAVVFAHGAMRLVGALALLAVAWSWYRRPEGEIGE